MNFLITFSNNETLTFSELDNFHAWKNDTSYLNVGEDQAFYLETIFSGNYQQAIQTAASKQLANEQPIIGLAGLLADADWLTIDANPAKYYRTSAIVSIEIQTN